MPIQFRLLHHLLHFLIGEGIGVIFVEHFKDLHVIDLVVRFEEPH